MANFRFEGKKYEVPDLDAVVADDKNKFVLPDGRLLRANGWIDMINPGCGWLETSNPGISPGGLRVESHDFQGLAPDEIAHKLNATLARVLEE